MKKLFWHDKIFFGDKHSPQVDFHRAKERQLVVISAMEKLGVITKIEAESARIEEIILAR